MPNDIPKISFVVTEHSLLRMKERMPNSVLPENGTFVRLITVRDTLSEKKLLVLKIKGGAIIGKWRGKHMIILTAFDEQTLHRLQKREQSRFIPINVNCYEVVNAVGRSID